jgi:hypothetical protein
MTFEVWDHEPRLMVLRTSVDGEAPTPPWLSNAPSELASEAKAAMRAFFDRWRKHVETATGRATCAVCGSATSLVHPDDDGRDTPYVEIADACHCCQPQPGQTGRTARRPDSTRTQRFRGDEDCAEGVTP